MWNVSSVNADAVQIKIITHYSQHPCHDARFPERLLAPQTDYLLNYPSTQTHSKMYETVIHLASHKYFSLVSRWGIALTINLNLCVSAVRVCVFVSRLLKQNIKTLKLTEWQSVLRRVLWIIEMPKPQDGCIILTRIYSFHHKPLMLKIFYEGAARGFIYPSEYLT